MTPTNVTGCLLDTHALLWMLHGDKRLSKKAAHTIDGKLPLHHSSVSFWEIAIKRKPPSVRRLNALAIMNAGGEYGRFQAACGDSDLIAGWAARFAAAQLAGSRASRSHGRVTGSRSMTS